MDIEQLGRQLMNGKNAGELQRLASSEAGERLGAGLDGGAVERALRAGDTAALSDMLRGVLSTPEGRRFADQVRKAMDDGR